MSRSKVAEFIVTLKKDPSFNPLLEERLPQEEQVLGLKALAHYWELPGTQEVLTALVRNRFFDVWWVGFLNNRNRAVSCRSLTSKER